MAKKNEIPYIMVRDIYIGDFNTKLQTTGNGTYKIVSPKSVISVDSDGSIDISGSSKVTIGGKNLDFSQLPDRYIREDGVPWDWIRNNTSVYGAIPIRINGHKVYIPFMDKAPED